MARKFCSLERQFSRETLRFIQLRFSKYAFITHLCLLFRQNPRFGDAFWKEDLFLMYLLRLLSNFASIYHVHYLPPQTRMEDEMPEDFACI
jgi:hypothetical protein